MVAISSVFLVHIDSGVVIAVRNNWEERVTLHLLVEIVAEDHNVLRIVAYSAGLKSVWQCHESSALSDRGNRCRSARGGKTAAYLHGFVVQVTFGTLRIKSCVHMLGSW